MDSIPTSSTSSRSLAPEQPVKHALLWVRHIHDRLSLLAGFRLKRDSSVCNTVQHLSKIQHKTGKSLPIKADKALHIHLELYGVASPRCSVRIPPTARQPVAV